MPTDDEIAHKQEMIAIHRRRLETLELQAAGFGALYVPPHIANEIHNLNSEIARLEEEIRALESPRAPVEDSAAKVEPTPVESQRKIVTILFADVSGFTALSETSDPEDITKIINALWKRLDTIVCDHGGRIDKHIGDALMALWSAGITREDDAEQAVRAALDIQRALEAFRQEQGLEIAMRVGINTGKVVFGPVGNSSEITATGDAVNLASRIEQAAPVGAILISHDTYRHIRGRFDVQSQVPLTVKGKAAPIQTYVVLAVKPRAFWMDTRGVEGVETRMIGRESDMTALREAYLDAVDGTEMRMVTLVGDMGVGKSRLLREFQFWVDLREESAWLLRGRAIPETLQYAGGLLRDILSFRCQVSDTDGVGDVRAKLTQGLAPMLNADEIAILGQAAGFDFSDVPAVQSLLASADFTAVDFTTIASTYLERYLHQLTDTSPTILLLEDLHWADDRSLDLLDMTLAKLTKRRLLVVATARSILHERRPDWGAGQPYSTRRELSLLSPRVSHELVGEILQRATVVPALLRDMIVTQAEGNPFYIEELIKMLIEQGVIVRGADADAAWTIHLDQLKAINVPPTLEGVLQSRLESLPATERLTLQRASVIGREFWDAAVTALDEEPKDNAALTLNSLRERELVFHHERSAFAGTQEYVFKHGLLRDVTYESVLKDQRLVYHQRAAEWLERVSGARVEEYAALIADHYARREDKPTEGRWQARAGMHAAAQHANKEAIRRLERALELLPAGSEELDCLMALSDLNFQQSKFADAQKELERARVRAHEIGDTAREVQALASLGDIFRIHGEFASAHRSYQESLTIARAADQTPRLRAALASSLKGAGTLANQQGDSIQAEQLYQEGLTIRRALGDEGGVATLLNNLGMVAMSQAQYDKAQSLFEDGLALFQKIGDRFAISALLNNLGLIARYQGDMQKARTYFEEAFALSRELGDRWGEANSLNGLTNLLLHNGVTDGVRAMLVESLTINHELKDRVAIAYCLEDFAGLATLAGAHERALKLAGAAAAMRTEVGSPLFPPEQAALDTLLKPSRAALTELDALFRSGGALDMDAAVALALAEE